MGKLWLDVILKPDHWCIFKQDGGKYRVTTRNAKGAIEKLINFEVEEKEEDKDDKDDWRRQDERVAERKSGCLFVDVSRRRRERTKFCINIE